MICLQLRKGMRMPLSSACAHHVAELYLLGSVFEL